MKLDSRILEGKRPLTCLDIERAREFVGKECIFSDFYINYFDIEKFNIDNDNEHTGILSINDNSSDYIFINDRNKSRYRFILPCEWVKEPEKKYREYKDLDEFFDVTGLEIGDLIKLKFPGNNVAELLIVGSCYNGLFIGIHKYTFKQLFEIVEISISGEWKPFGVVDEGVGE